MREKTKIKVSSYNIACIETTNETEEEKRKKIEKVRVRECEVGPLISERRRTTVLQ